MFDNDLKDRTDEIQILAIVENISSIIILLESLFCSFEIEDDAL